MTTSFRASPPSDVSTSNLGPLAELRGNWTGKGFNFISLPNKEGNTEFRIMMSSTAEQLTFSNIGAPIPDRGSAQDDIEFSGLHYLQQINDAISGAALHLEPGLWLNVPATTEPLSPATVVRQGSVPHGDSFLAQGSWHVFDGPPVIPTVSTTPIKLVPPPLPNGYFGDPPPPMPPGIPRQAFNNPNQVLVNAIAGQKIVRTIELKISTHPVGGIINIPFVTKNANATRMDATFWIETVQHADGSLSMQLQYSQVVILDFLQINWPHVSVATLVKR